MQCSCTAPRPDDPGAALLKRGDKRCQAYMRAQQDKNGGTAARDAHGQHAHSLFTRGVRGPDQMRTVSTRTARLHEGSGAEGGEGDRARTLQAQQRMWLLLPTLTFCWPQPGQSPTRARSPSASRCALLRASIIILAHGARRQVQLRPDGQQYQPALHASAHGWTGRVRMHTESSRLDK